VQAALYPVRDLIRDVDNMARCQREMPRRRLFAFAVCFVVLAMSLPASDAAMECCPAPGNSSYARCMLPYTWEELASGYKEGRLDFMTGGMGQCSTRHQQSWLCIRPHPCSDNVLDRFCFVFNETSLEFVPLGKNKDLGIISLEGSSRHSVVSMACCDYAAATLSVIEERFQSFNTSFYQVAVRYR
jgi:hypothetical protein